MSRTVQIKFPQICVGVREIEIPDGEYPEEGGHYDMADFIWNHMTEDEKENAPKGKKGVFEALDCNFAHVKVIEK